MKQPADRRKWTRTIDSLPPENVAVETKIDDHMGVRNRRELYLLKGLWYYPDSETYVFNEPMHWREKQKQKKQNYA